MATKTVCVALLFIGSYGATFDPTASTTTFGDRSGVIATFTSADVSFSIDVGANTTTATVRIYATHMKY